MHKNYFCYNEMGYLGTGNLWTTKTSYTDSLRSLSVGSFINRNSSFVERSVEALILTAVLTENENESYG